MSAVASGLSFEVLRFTADAGAAPTSRCSSSRGASAPRRAGAWASRACWPRATTARIEVAPAAADEAQAEPDGGPWRASYAVALELLDDGSFALAVGRELLVGLPAPDLGGGRRGDREVRLAREANALRAHGRRGARRRGRRARPRPSSERQAREATEAEMAEARMARDDHARRACAASTTSWPSCAASTPPSSCAATRSTPRRSPARDEEAARAADERVAELEAEAAEARRALRARAGRGRGACGASSSASASAPRRPRPPCRRGRVTELDGEPVQRRRRHRRAAARRRGVGPHAGAAARRAAASDVAARRRRGPGRRARRADDDDRRLRPPATSRRPRSPSRRAAPSAMPATADETRPRSPRASGERAVAGDPGETVRVLGARRPRRTGEGTPAEAAARHRRDRRPPHRARRQTPRSAALAAVDRPRDGDRCAFARARGRRASSR